MRVGFFFWQKVVADKPDAPDSTNNWSAPPLPPPSPVQVFTTTLSATVKTSTMPCCWWATVWAPGRSPTGSSRTGGFQTTRPCSFIPGCGLFQLPLSLSPLEAGARAGARRATSWWPVTAATCAASPTWPATRWSEESGEGPWRGRTGLEGPRVSTQAFSAKRFRWQVCQTDWPEPSLDAQSQTHTLDSVDLTFAQATFYTFSRLSCEPSGPPFFHPEFWCLIHFLIHFLF